MRRLLVLALPSLLLLTATLARTPAPATATSPKMTPPAAQTPVLRPVVVARYPHDPGAFTQGLQYVGAGRYLESTGLVGESVVRFADLKTGKTRRQAALPLAQGFGEGSALLGNTVYYLSWRDGVAYTFDRTLQGTGRHEYQGEGWGLTHDGKLLIMSNGSPTLTWRDPRTFAAVRSVEVTDQGQPVKNLNELEYVQGAVYANVWLTDRIARIHPSSGKVTAWIDVSALTREVSSAGLGFDDVANGIAFVPERGTLLLTGKRWPTIFEVKLPGLKVEPPQSRARN